jgi:hypothetical protein
VGREEAGRRSVEVTLRSGKARLSRQGRLRAPSREVGFEAEEPFPISGTIPLPFQGQGGTFPRSIQESREAVFGLAVIGAHLS